MVFASHSLGIILKSDEFHLNQLTPFGLERDKIVTESPRFRYVAECELERLIKIR